MIPGVDPRQLKTMMKQLGMQQVDIDADQVIIKSGDKTLVFNKPTVHKVTMQGQTTFQITGSYSQEEVQVEVSISEDDIKTVAEQANVSDEKAKEALEKTNGDIAEAIVNLSEEQQ